MTLREQIEQRAEEYAWVSDMYDPKAAYKAGAEYGYNLALERVVKLLEDKLGYMPVIPQGLPEDVVKAQTKRAYCAYKFIEYLKQAMKL